MQQAPQGQPMAQGAPQAAPAPSGGGLGDILGSIFAPKATAQNKTAGWLQSQGYDEVTARAIAGDPQLLRSVIANRGQADKPIEVNGKFVDPHSFKVLADFSTPKERKIQNDANGVPRYTDTGEAVYPSDQSSSGGTQFFSGKSIDAQGLNYLIDQKVLTKQQAAEVAAGKQVTGPNGEIIFMTPQGLVQQPAGGGQATPIQSGQGGGNPGQGGNVLTGPKYSEDMRKAGGFALRAEEADKIVSDPKITAAGASYGENLKNAAPFGLGNYLTSDDFQKYDQAQRDFVNAVLRRESGAAISESEFENARKQYFPVPGNGPDVIAQKARNRQLAVQSLHQSADPVPSMNGGGQPQAASNGAPAAPDAAPKAAPVVGETRYGYRFKGGDPSDPANWEKAR
jgi:hypothetical protein